MTLENHINFILHGPYRFPIRFLKHEKMLQQFCDYEGKWTGATSYACKKKLSINKKEQFSVIDVWWCGYRELKTRIIKHVLNVSMQIYCGLYLAYLN